MKGYIYKIINLKNGKFYVGSSLYPHKRKIRHFRDLREGRHHSVFLQRAYNLYGEENFTFVIVKEREFDSERELRELEERYINFCWNSGKLYNVSKKGSGGDLVTYNPRFDEIKEKQRKASLEVWENKTSEEKQAYSEKMKGSGNPNYGNKWTEEQRKRASIHHKEYYKINGPTIKRGTTFEELFGEDKAKEIKIQISEHAKTRTGEKNPFYGKHHSEETKKIISENNKGILPTNAKKVFYNGVIYDSAQACANDLGIKHGTICYRCREELYGFKYV